MGRPSRSRRSGRKRLYVRHYCTRCGGRVFPFDQYEAATEAHSVGASGAPILLRTYNAKDPEDREAWCFSCNRLVAARRMTEVEFLQLYINRRGVVVREATNHNGHSRVKSR